LCTIGFAIINGKRYLFKNRDKVEYEKETVDLSTKHIGIRSKDAEYFLAAINRFGVGFVTAEVLSTKLISRVLSGVATTADVETYYLKYKRPMGLITPILHNLRSAREVITFLDNLDNNCNIKPYNILISDRKDAFAVELYDTIIKVEEIKNATIKTNHFIYTDYGPKVKEDFPSSFYRRDRGFTLLTQISSFHDLQYLLKDHFYKDPEKNICRHGSYHTISSTIIDISGRFLFYSDRSPCKAEYKNYKLEENICAE